MSQADEPSYAELKRLYAELVLECAAAKDRNVAYRLQIQNKANENMTYIDTQLKQALAKMLPRTVCYGSPQGSDGLYWRPRWNGGSYRSVSDTELLHLCWMVEETLIEIESADYAEHMRPIDEHYKLLYHARWQKRVVMLAKVKGIEI